MYAAGAKPHKKVVELTKRSDQPAPAQNFYEEAELTPQEFEWLRSKFEKAWETLGVRNRPVRLGVGTAEEEHLLNLEGFVHFVERYKLLDAQEAEWFFNAMDRDGDGFLSCEEFTLGLCASDPKTTHILNSFTGFERAKYIFSIYNTSKSGTLTYGELAVLLMDANYGSRKGYQLNDTLDKVADRLQSPELVHQVTTLVANDLAELSLVTIMLVGFEGPIGTLQVSAKWTWWTVKHEIERVAGIPAGNGQQLFIDELLLPDEDCVEKSLPQGSGPALAPLEVTVIRKPSEDTRESTKNGASYFMLPWKQQQEKVQKTHRLGATREDAAGSSASGMISTISDDSRIEVDTHAVDNTSKRFLLAQPNCSPAKPLAQPAAGNAKDKICVPTLYSSMKPHCARELGVVGVTGFGYVDAASVGRILLQRINGSVYYQPGLKANAEVSRSQAESTQSQVTAPIQTAQHMDAPIQCEREPIAKQKETLGPAVEDAPERFMHLTFNRVYGAVAKEKLRGFSGLFRLKRSWRTFAAKSENARTAGA